MFRVIICTLSTSSYLVSAGGLRGFFTHIFVDESGQATEPGSFFTCCEIFGICFKWNKSLKKMNIFRKKIVIWKNGNFQHFFEKRRKKWNLILFLVKIFKIFFLKSLKFSYFHWKNFWEKMKWKFQNYSLFPCRYLGPHWGTRVAADFADSRWRPNAAGSSHEFAGDAASRPWHFDDKTSNGQKGLPLWRKGSTIGHGRVCLKILTKKCL